jgi:hypothetical protein
MRVVLALAVVAAIVLLTTLVRQALHRRTSNVAPRRDGAALPARITAGADRTWVVFTTPWCATCDPVVDRLRRDEPGSRVVKIDATVERSLADALGVRSAPTTVLAGSDGIVQAQLVGAGAVGAYLEGTT